MCKSCTDLRDRYADRSWDTFNRLLEETAPLNGTPIYYYFIIRLLKCEFVFIPYKLRVCWGAELTAWFTNHGKTTYFKHSVYSLAIIGNSVHYFSHAWMPTWLRRLLQKSCLSLSFMIDAWVDHPKVTFLKIPNLMCFLLLQEGSWDFTTRNMRFSHHFQVSFGLTSCSLWQFSLLIAHLDAHICK